MNPSARSKDGDEIQELKRRIRRIVNNQNKRIRAVAKRQATLEKRMIRMQGLWAILQAAITAAAAAIATSIVAGK